MKIVLSSAYSDMFTERRNVPRKIAEGLEIKKPYIAKEDNAESGIHKGDTVIEIVSVTDDMKELLKRMADAGILRLISDEEKSESKILNIFIKQTSPYTWAAIDDLLGIFEKAGELKVVEKTKAWDGVRCIEVRDFSDRALRVLQDLSFTNYFVLKYADGTNVLGSNFRPRHWTGD